MDAIATTLIVLASTCGLVAKYQAIPTVDEKTQADTGVGAASLLPPPPGRYSFSKSREQHQPGTMIVTAYCPCRRCCGPNARGVTASGKCVAVGMCAARRKIPFGTVLHVPGYGRAVVEDRGAAIRGNRLDVFFPTHEQARAWGKRLLKVRFSPESVVNRKGRHAA
jgi:3D (Asp-Asp-Asp) domain-containing protein